MEKNIRIIISIFFILIIVIFLINPIKDYSTHTKAICDKSNFCQDYLITCENKKIMEMIPITGAAIQFSENWQDIRNKEIIENFCE